MKSEADKRRQRTPQHKRSTRRRVANKARQLLLVVAGLCLTIGLVFSGLAFLRKYGFTDWPWILNYIYLGTALVLFLLRALLGLRRRRTHAADDE